ncbi:MmpS family transport accessory protein [Mycolicibacterium sp. 120270]|uniref:MmpS family transport accessory protein n=1 Tax=Mycolicibacterium sp. 120270 TaxID=3090600 RepID=UPI00299EF223|nr:MmpS family transport accessory protein [Mycolicibacterium sp. 120270]MDX1881952.1 MmpS family transport accessory protein [Mycolicibacterium sp. 120270]
MVLVLAVAGFAVLRIRGVFGSHELPTYAGSMSDNTNKTDPKSLIYEVWGPPGATADINYIDDEGETNQVNDATLPWSHEIISNAPSVMGNIVAQGDSDFIGCRITSDGEVKDERTVNQVSAYIYCVVKSA